MYPSGLAVVALDRAIDPERGEESVSHIRHGGAKAVLTGKSPATAMGDRSPEGQPLKDVILLLLPGIEAKPPDYFRLVGRIRSQDSLAIECAHPILDAAAGNVPVNRSAGAAVGRSSSRVQERRQRSFHKIQVGCAYQFFLGVGLFVLSSLELESRDGLDVDVQVAKRKAVAGGSIEQHRVVIVRAEVALKTETSTPNEKRVRRRAIAVVSTVIALEVSVRLNLELTVCALYEEMLPIPAGDHGGLFFLSRLLVRWLGRLSGLRRFSGGLGLHNHGIHEVSTVRCLLAGLERMGSVGRLWVSFSQSLNHRFQFLDGLPLLGDFAAQLLDFFPGCAFLGCARRRRCYVFVGGSIALCVGERTQRDEKQYQHEACC